MKRKQKRFKTGEERALLFDLYHNALYKQKVIPNKKKKNDRKTWKCKKESYYQNLLQKVGFDNNFLKVSYELKVITMSMYQA